MLGAIFTILVYVSAIIIIAETTSVGTKPVIIIIKAFHGHEWYFDNYCTYHFFKVHTGTIESFIVDVNA